jgi:uncharacterized membrane protein
MDMETRIRMVDIARGSAIVLMIIYHTAFDINFLGLSPLAMSEGPWSLLQKLTGFMFVSIAGISLALSERGNRTGYERHFKRALRLGIIALLITAATWVYPHEPFVKFGVIHMLALATLIAPFFLRFGVVNVLLGLLIIIGGIMINEHTTDNPWLFWLGLRTADYTSLDHYPLLPWFGVFLIGTFAGSKIEQKKQPEKPSGIAALLGWMGRHSIQIYILHQPALMAILMLISASGILGP